MADTEHDFKMRFAELLQRYPKDQRSQYYSTVAKATIGKDAAQYPLFVIEISEKWPIDDDVVAEIARRDKILPEKEVVLREIYEKANDRFAELKEKAPYYKMLLEAMGWIPQAGKDGPATNAEVSRIQSLLSAVQNPIDT